MRWISSPGSITIASPAASSPRRVQLHCNGPTGNVSRIMVLILGGSGSSRRRPFYSYASLCGHWFAEGDRVEFAVFQQFDADVFHFRRYQINGYGHWLLAVPVKAASIRDFLVGALHVLFSFVLDHQMASRLGDADHFAESFGAVGEEVEAAAREDHVKARVGEGQRFGIAQIEIGVLLPAAQVVLAVGEHLKGEIEAGDFGPAREVFEVETGADGGLEHGIAWFDLQQAHVDVEI